MLRPLVSVDSLQILNTNALKRLSFLTTHTRFGREDRERRLKRTLLFRGTKPETKFITRVAIIEVLGSPIATLCYFSLKPSCRLQSPSVVLADFGPQFAALP